MKSPYLVPGAIIFAGLVLALAIFFVRGGGNTLPEGDPSFMRPVSPDEHLLGNPTAPVTVVVYSDIDCAYCKQFQETMLQILADDAESGLVAMVYRHFPLIQIHPYAAEHAEAAECVAEQGGNTAFFRFIDQIHQAAPEGIEFNPDKYPDLVNSLGLSLSAFESCRESDRFVSKVAADFDNAIEAGATGAPYIVILVRGSDTIPVSGALPYTSMRKVIDAALAKVQ